ILARSARTPWGPCRQPGWQPRGSDGPSARTCVDLKDGTIRSLMATAYPALPPPPAAVRWGVLVFVSLAMFGNYYVYDSIAPLADILRTELGFSSTQVGTLNAIYSAPNIVMVLIGGILVDRFGTRNATLGFTFICLLGALLTASSSTFTVMALGRLVF